MAKAKMQTHRNDVIDAFRGVAILAVMAFHYTVRWAPPEYPQDIYHFGMKFPLWLDNGRWGVDLFFVISGLVISMTALRSNSWLDFGIKRFARLFPAMVVASAITCVICASAPSALRSSWGDYFASLTLFPDKLGRLWVDGSYWSLAVEVKFYAWVALSVALFKREFWAGLCVLGWIGCIFAKNRAVHAAVFPEYWPFFLLGISAWYALLDHRWVPMLTSAASGLGTLAWINPGLTPSMLVLGASALMFVLIGMNARIPVLPSLGRRSYSLYLIHQNLGVYAISLLLKHGTPPIPSIALSSALMIALSWLLFRWVETPGKDLILAGAKRLRHRRASFANNAKPPSQAPLPLRSEHPR